MAESRVIIPLIEATVHIQVSEDEKGKLLFSEIERDTKAWEATPSAVTRVQEGPTKGYYTFFVRLPVSRLQDFKDFLRQFCKEQKLLIDL